MELQEYQKVYLNLEIAVSQSQLIALVASEVLADFPKRLPEEARDAIFSLLSSLEKAVKLALDTLEGNPKSEVEEDVPDGSNPPLDSPIIMPTLRLLLASARLSERQHGIKVEFDNLLCSQELVMVLAHLDAFLVTSLRTICLREPNVLRRNKKISWEEVLSCDNWESLLDRLMEEYCYDFGWKSIQKRVQYLQAEHGLDIKTPASVLDALDWAEKTRHIIIHNGGKVSQEYLNRTQKTDVKIGDTIPVDAEYVTEVAYQILELGSDIFVAVARKFFDAKETDLTGIWWRRDDLQRLGQANQSLEPTH